MYWRYGPQASPPAGSDNGYYWSGHPMMGWFGNSNASWVVGSVFWLITWLLIIAVLVALVRWLWKKGDSEKRR